MSNPLWRLSRVSGARKKIAYYRVQRAEHRPTAEDIYQAVR